MQRTAYHDHVVQHFDARYQCGTSLTITQRLQHTSQGAVNPVPSKAMDQTYAKISCRVCGQSGGISKNKIRRLSGPAVVIGYLFLIPSVLGMASGLMTMCAGGRTAISLGMGLFLLIGSFVGGLVGWILTMKKTVLLCANCKGVHADAA